MVYFAPKIRDISHHVDVSYMNRPLLPLLFLLSLALGHRGLACDALPASPAPTDAGVNEFTDTDLQSVLGPDAPCGETGLIYVWSPHMPYSVRGLVEIRDLAAARDLTVIDLVDPHADAALTRHVSQHSGSAAPRLRAMRSTKLYHRGVTLHYPSLVVFRDGQILEPLLPGYARASVYAKFIDEHLGN